MSDLARIILALVVFIAAFAGVVVVGGVGWLGSVKDEYQAERGAIEVEAREFASGNSQESCVDEAVLRMTECDGMVCRVKTQDFLLTCLAESQPSPGFCAAVPPRDEIMASARWSVDECSVRGAGDSSCARLLRGVQEYCSAP